ncbi:HEAT repeat domain-containing protein [Methylomonas sp. LL1]|uniref:HEAT repeat domain-containing protein n=1 Tax=Methylomonas sp. LL1 TaxID=2785785 RepID=UPI0018C42F02|nr:HEAT repeat domain-containing protein [Methylomonas sp. LL1]QPK61783.1 HEAT repeat domain-containing protein [Methylomonas sp. LL1]
MAIQLNTLSLKFIVFVFALLLSGCTKSFNIKPVPPPNNVYTSVLTTETRSFGLSDARTGEAKPLNAGTLSVELPDMGDEMNYLGDNLARVLNAQGIQVAYDKGENSDLKLKVLNYRIRNLRTSGFSPYHTFTTFSADLIGSGAPQRITAYFKNSKVPVWAFREVERPCYQIPLEVVVKEIAAKLNAHVFKRAASNETVEKIVKSIMPGSADAASEQYLKVLELGYTNNPAAIEPLVRLTSHEETIMREAAISALGILGAKEKFPLLKTIYETKYNIDKSMALKSIGDLDTPQARDFIRQVKMSEAYKDDETIKEVADLYP